jgi:hypothetical protein
MPDSDQSREMRTRTAKGSELASRWGLAVQHALYRETGNWYHHLKRFPGAFLDRDGYVIFETEADFRNCSELQFGKDVHVPHGIKSIANYVCWTSPEARALEAVVRPRMSLGGQRFASSPMYRQAVELYAMQLAYEHYSARWPIVLDVSTTQPFDLHCLNGSLELRVEVKGTASAGDSVLLTRNEVSHAQQHSDCVALFVVSHIKVDSAGLARGGQVSRFEPWQIETSQLAPIAYEYRLRDRSTLYSCLAAEHGHQADG